MLRQSKVLILSGGAITGIVYLACVLWDMLFPGFAMNSVWAGLFPGFVWLTWWGFLLGLAESVLYGAFLGWLIAVIPSTAARMVR
jgi:hypothetical protein